MNTLVKITPEVEKRCILIKLAIAISDNIKNNDEFVVKAINAIEYNEYIYELAKDWYRTPQDLDFYGLSVEISKWNEFIEAVQLYDSTK